MNIQKRLTPMVTALMLITSPFLTIQAIDIKVVDKTTGGYVINIDGVPGATPVEQLKSVLIHSLKDKFDLSNRALFHASSSNPLSNSTKINSLANDNQSITISIELTSAELDKIDARDEIYSQTYETLRAKTQLLDFKYVYDLLLKNELKDEMDHLEHADIVKIAHYLAYNIDVEFIEPFVSLFKVLLKSTPKFTADAFIEKAKAFKVFLQAVATRIPLVESPISIPDRAPLRSSSSNALERKSN